ncbi:MAG: TraX family protein [Enterobacteriaceae bacterium]
MHACWPLFRHLTLPPVQRWPVLMTVLTVGLVSCAGKSLPRFWPGDFFPVFYACHLAVLGVLAL